MFGCSISLTVQLALYFQSDPNNVTQVLVAMLVLNIIWCLILLLLLWIQGKKAYNRRFHNGGQIVQDPQNDLQQQINHNHIEVNLPLTEDQLKQLKVISFMEQFDLSEEAKLQYICSICNQNLKQGDLLYSIPCEHIFHRDCLYPWLNLKSTCPNCRTPIANWKFKLNIFFIFE